MDTVIAPPQLQGSEFLFASPEVLDSAAHATLRFQAGTNVYAAAAQTNFVPLQVREIMSACMHYPIVFAGPEFIPMAVMGIRSGENLFMEEGRFVEGTYIPAYVRRYPFTLAQGEGNQRVVCIDRDAPCFVDGGEGPSLFEEGKATQFVLNAVGFLKEYEAERALTQEFSRALRELDLLEARQTTRQMPGSDQPEVLAQYYAVSEAKLPTLAPEALAGLCSSGALLQIHAHMLSLQHWSKLSAMDERVHRNAPGAAGGADA